LLESLLKLCSRNLAAQIVSVVFSKIAESTGSKEPMAYDTDKPSNGEVNIEDEKFEFHKYIFSGTLRVSYNRSEKARRVQSKYSRVNSSLDISAPSLLQDSEQKWGSRIYNPIIQQSNIASSLDLYDILMES